MALIDKIKSAIKAFSINSDEQQKTKFLFIRESGFGTKQSNGFLFEEYSDRFKSKYERQQLFMRMDNDGQVFQMRNAIALTKSATNFFVDPFTEDDKEPTPQDKVIADFVQDALFEKLNQGFKGLLDDINLYVRDGFSLFELYFEKKNGGFYPQLTRIACETVFRRRTSEDEPGIQQLAYYPKGKEETDDPEANEGFCTINVPANKLILFNINAEGTNYEGWGLYRKIAKDRFFKDKFENYHAVLQERLAIPPLKVKVPQGTLDDEVAKYNEIAKNMRSLESGYVTEYLDPDKGTALVGYEWMQTNIGDNANKLQEAIQQYQQNINDIFFEQFLYLGKSEKGSYGMASTSTEFFYQAVKGYLEKDVEIINRYLIPKIVALNFGETERMPRLKFGQVGFVDVTAFGKSMAEMATAGVIKPNYETENHIRQLLHLPEMSEEEYNSIATTPSTAIDTNKKPLDVGDDGEQPSAADQEKAQAAKQEADDNIQASQPKKKAKSVTKKHTKKCTCDKCQPMVFTFDHEAIIQHQIAGIPPQNSTAKRNFSDPILGGFRRPLTFAERRVAFTSIKDNLKSEKDSIVKQYSEISNNMSDKLLAQVRVAVEKNDINAIVDLTAKYGADISALVSSSYKKMFDYGKNEASREIGVEIPSSKKDLKDVIKIHADNIATGITSKVESNTKTIVATAIEKNVGVKNTVASDVVLAVKQSVQPYLDQAGGLLSTIAIDQAFNSGRKSVAYINSDKIYAAQYSAILDDVTCDYCMSLDAQVVKLDSSEYDDYSPPNHINCRCMRVFINDDEDFKPDLTDISDEIPVKTSLTSGAYLKAPMVKAGSAASSQIQKEIDWRQANNDSLNGARKDKNEEIISRLQNAIE